MKKRTLLMTLLFVSLCLPSAQAQAESLSSAEHQLISPLLAKALTL